MSGLIRAALLAVAFACSGAWAQEYPTQVPGAAAPTDLAAPPGAPDPADSNAQRAQTQPGNNAPFWRGVRDSATVPSYTTLPGNEGATLIQDFVQYPGTQFTTAGEAWRQIRNQWLLPYGGWLLVAVIVLIALFYAWKGALGHHEMGSARRIERFTYFERAAHWTNAIAFVTLAVSGVVMAFGKFLLLPLIGATLFGWLSYALKTIHNFVGPVFAVTLVVVFFTFLRDNWPKRHDFTWLAKGGGMLSGHEVPSHRFNAGEKVVFWGGVLFLGVIVVASGLVLDKIVPGLSYTRGQMQVAHIVHALGAVLMMAMFLGHIYIGTLGMKGAFSAMRTGRVDEGWAKEHHELWYDDIKAGRIPAQRSTPDVEAPAARPKTV